MKIRLRFVSNSSSSSFLIVSDKSANNIKIIVKAKISEFLKNKACNIDDISEELDWDWIFKNYEPGDVMYIRALELKDQLQKALNEGKYIYMGTFSTEDGGISEALTYPDGDIEFDDNESTKLIYHSGINM